MFHSLMIFHIVISVLLIVLVLLQFGKGAEAGLMSGGGGGDSTFSGPQKGSILGKMTTLLAVLFLGNSILLAKIQSTSSTSSLLDGEAPIAAPLNNDAMIPKAQETTAPAATTEETKK